MSAKTRSIYTILTVFLSLMLSSVFVFAEGDITPASYELDGTVYSLNEYGEMTITGGTTVQQSAIQQFAYQTDIKSVTIGEGITAVGSYAFSGCTALEDVVLPEGLEKLGNSAFGNCTALESINIPKDVIIYGNSGSYYANSYYSPFTNSGIKTVTFEEGTTNIASGLFAYAKNLESTEIPEGVTTVGAGAFYNCTSLAEVVLPSTLEKIDNSAFSGCSSLTEITLPENLSIVGDGAFSGTKLTSINIPKSLCNSSQSWSIFSIDTLKEITFDEGVEIIPNSMFSNCTGLETVTIPSTVKTIGDYAFRGCTSLADITLPTGLTSIGSNTFSECTSLTDITLPASLTSIGSYAFSRCNSLAAITLPAGLEKLGNSAFGNCTALESINIPKDVTVSGSSSSYFNSYYSPFANSGIKSASFDKGTTNIAYGLFSHVVNLESIDIPEGVTTIGAGAFYNCTALSEVGLPSTLERIDGSAFSGCSSLTEIILPSNLSSVGSDVFSGTKLTKINIPKSLCNSSQSGSVFRIETLKEIIFDEGVEIIPNSMFSNCTGLETVTIPSTVETIGDNAFSGCTGLSQIMLDTGLTSIGLNAFNGCTSLSAITLPAGLEKLGNSAFGNCIALESINIPKDVTVSGSSSSYFNSYYSPFANSGIKSVTFEEGTTGIAYGLFSHVVNLESIDIPEGVTTIGAGAFYNCTALSEVGLPSTLERIDGSAFSGCSSLTEIILPSNLSSVGSDAFSGTKLTKINIPKSLCNSLQSGSVFRIDTLKEIIFDEGVEIIPNSMFSNCTGLETVTIPSTVDTIGDYAFRGCTSLADITLPTGLTSIGSNTFSECTSLTDITLPENLTSIGSYAFSGCNSLAAITLPAGLEKLGNSAFGNCTALESINIPKDVTVSGSSSSYFNSYYSPFANSGIKSFSFDKGTTNIAYGLFSHVVNLESIEIPEGVTTIGAGAFYNCTALSEVGFSSTLERIDGSAFSGCSSLTEIILPSNLSSVGSDAFSGTRLIKINIPKSLCNSSQSGSVFRIETLKEIIFDEGVEIIPNSMFSNCTGLEAVTIPSTVETIGDNAFSGCTGLSQIMLDTGLTSIGSYAFNGCTSLTDISLPSGLEKLGNSAFGNCTALESINIPKDVSVFGSSYSYSYSYHSPFANSGIKSVTFEEGTTGIAYGLFSHVVNLESIDIPEGVTAIGVGAFYNCTALSEVGLPSTLERIDNSAFSGCSSLTEIILPSNLSSVGSDAFSGTKLTKINIPKSMCNSSQSGGVFRIDTLKEIIFDEGVEIIPNSMFSNCTGLETVTIPSTVKTIGDYAFSGCTGLSQVMLDFGVTSIGPYAFNGCTSLPDITLPAGLEKLGNSAFGNCTALESINIPKDITVLGSAYSYSYSYYSPFANSGLKSVTFEEGTTGIASGLFSHAKNLESIDIPEGVTAIGAGAFYNCTALSEVGLPSTLERIDGSAFSGCTSLTEISLPESLKTIGDNAFAYCTGFSEITIPSKVTAVGSSPFYGCTGITEMTFRCSSCPSGSPLYDVSNLKTVYVPPSAFEEYYRAFSSSLPSGAEIKTDFYSVPVSNLMTDGVYGTSVKLTWDNHVFSEITTYSVDANGVNVYTGSSPAVITRLETGKEYTFDVCGMNATGKKTIPASVTVTPLAPEVISITTDPDNEPLPAGKVNFIVTLKDTGNLVSAESSESAISGVLNLKKKNSQSNLLSGDFVQDTADPQKFICNIDLADVNNGEYEAEVVFTDPSGCTGMSSKNIRVDSGMPNGPEIVSISPADGSMVGVGYKTVGVTARAESNLASIKIEYSLNGTDFNTLLNVKNLNTTSYNARAELPVDRVKDGDTIYVRASATDSAGNTSPVCTASYKADKTAPAVQNVSATFNDREDAVEISWIGGGEKDLAGYRIYRKDSLLGGYNLVGQKAAAADTSEYSFLDRSISPEETNYKYKVEAVDVCGNTSEETAEITTPDRSWPVAVLNCESVMELNKEYVIDASQSTDNKGIKTYHIDFGDGTTSDEAAPTHTYTETGYFTILLTVTDGDGHEDTAKKRVEVFDSTKVGTAVIHVMDENGSAVSGAPVYFDLGADNQVIRNTDSSGIARFTADKGIHMIGCVMTDNQWLPAKGEIEVEAGKNNEATLTITRHEMVEGSFEVHEMTLEEIEAAGIDTSDPDNQYNVKVTVYLKYESIPYVVETIYNPKTCEGGDIKPIIVHDSDSSSGGRYIVYPHVISRSSGSDGSPASPSSSVPSVSAIGYIVIPIDISALKEFFNVDLTIVNNAGEEFSMLDNVVNLNLPDGLTLMDVPSSAKKTVSMNEIKGQTSETLSWILRGDKVGDYYLSADYSGILSEFNMPVTTRFEATDPVKVEGLSNIRLKVLVPQNLPTGKLYYAACLENEGDKNVYKPDVDTDNTVVGAKYYSASTDITTLDLEAYTKLKDIETEPDVLSPGEGIAKYYYYDTDMPYAGTVGNLKDYFYEVGEDYGLNVEIIPVPFSYFEEILELNKEEPVETKTEFLAYEYGTLNKIEDVEATYSYTSEKTMLEINHKGYYPISIENPTIYVGSMTRLCLVPESTRSCISAVHCQGYDALVNGVTAGSCDRKFKIYVYSSLPEEEVATYGLLQNGKLIQEREDGVFTVDPSAVEWNTYFSVQLVRSDGLAMPELLTSIKVIEEVFPEEDISFDSDINMTIPEEIPFIGGEKLKFSLSELKITVDFDPEKNKLKIGFGCEMPTDEKWADYKKLSQMFTDLSDRQLDKYMEKYNQYLNIPTGDFAHIPCVKESKKELKFVVFGYSEATISREGKTTKLDCFEGIINIKIKFKGEKQWQYIVVGIPVVAKVELGIDAGAKVSLGFDLNNVEFSLNGGVKFILPRFKASGGIGIMHICDVSLYGSAEHKLEFSTKKEDNKGKLEGTVGFSYTALFFSGEKEIMKGWIQYMPEWDVGGGTIFDGGGGYSGGGGGGGGGGGRGRKSPMLTKSAVNNILTDPAYYSIDTSDIDSASSWNGSPVRKLRALRNSSLGTDIRTLQSDVYDSADPQLVVTDDGIRMMIWTGTNTGRSVGNHTAVMYSVYNKSADTWSEPKIIEDDGSADFYPAAATDGNKVYVTWMDSKRNDFTSACTMEEVAASCEISAAVYDPEKDKFTAASLTDNSNLDAYPAIAAGGGEVYAVWNSNSASDMLTMSGTNTIMYSKYTDGAWSPASEFAVTDKPLTGLAAGILSSGTAIAYTADKDGDVTTSSDSLLYGGIIGGSVSEVSSSDTLKSNLQFSKGNGSTVLAWYEEGKICITKDLSEISTLESEGGVSSDFTIIENGDESVLLSVLPSEGDEDGSEIYYYKLNGTDLGEPVSVTKTNEYIHDFSAAMVDGEVRTVFTRTNAVIDDTITETTDLCTFDVKDYYDMTLDNVYTDQEAVKQGASIPVYLDVTNHGTMDETRIHVTAESGGAVRLDTTVDADIPVGTTETVTVDLPLGSKVQEGSQYTFTIEPASGIDADVSNNTGDLTVGYTDLELTAEKLTSIGKVAAIIAVDNMSCFDTKASVNVRRTDADGEILATYDIGTVKAGERYILDIDPDTIERISGGKGTLYVEAVTDSPELYSANNSGLIFVGPGGDSGSEHEHEWNDGTVTKEPTCKESGVKTYTCIHCGDTKEEEIPATGRHSFGEWTTVTEPTCSEPGVMRCACVNCGETKEESIPATGNHSFGEWITVTEPTVDSEGSKERVCSVCGKKEVETIAKLPKDDDHGGGQNPPDPGDEGDEHGGGQTPSDAEKAVEAAKKTLNSAIANARTIAQGYYSDKSYKALLDAIAEAEALEADPNATAEQLNAAVNKIEEARKALEVDPLKELGADGTPYGIGASAEAAENAIMNFEKNSDPNGTAFAPLLLKSTKQTASSVKLSWKRVSGAKTYVVYGNASGKNNKYKKLTTTSLSSYNVKRITKKLKKATSYKFIVVALDSTDHVVSTSKVIHAATKSKGNYTKVTTKAKKNKVSLKNGKSFKLGAKATGKKVKKYVSMRYESTNPEVATVNMSGKITANNKGTCYVYVFAQNGIYKKIKVTVK